MSRSGVLHDHQQDADADELRGFLQDHLAKFKIPAHVWFQREKLPRIASGKLFKRELKAKYAAELSG